MLVFFFISLCFSRLLISAHTVLLGLRTEQGEELPWALGRRCFVPPELRSVHLCLWERLVKMQNPFSADDKLLTDEGF